MTKIGFIWNSSIASTILYLLVIVFGALFSLVATCKKIEVDYFAKKAERPNDTADAKPNGSGNQKTIKSVVKETIDTVDAAEPTNDQAKNVLNLSKLEDIQEEDEEEMEVKENKKEEKTEGNLEDNATLVVEQLKIVEDYDSNSIPDEDEGCRSVDTSCDSYETGLSRADVASDSEHKKSSSSSNFSMDSIYGVNSELDFEERMENLGKKRPNSADDNDAKTKKHKNDNDSMNEDDLGRIFVIFLKIFLRVLLDSNNFVK